MKSPQIPLKKPEFVALMAMSFSTIAFSIDSMLPSLPEIGAALTPDNLNRAQLVLTSFVLGMGLGTFFTGPLSDTFGRRPVLLGGFVIYMIASIWAMMAGSLEMLLAARMLQGIGVAGPRVVAMAVIRDQYSGRQMAQLMSFVMMVFTLVPAFAPSLGALIIAVVGWRGLFGAFVLFALINGSLVCPAPTRNLATRIAPCLSGLGVVVGRQRSSVKPHRAGDNFRANLDHGRLVFDAVIGPATV